jgi:hypothetical protein
MVAKAVLGASLFLFKQAGRVYQDAQVGYGLGRGCEDWR